MKTKSYFLLALAVWFTVQTPLWAQGQTDNYLNNAWDTSQDNGGSSSAAPQYQNQAQDYAPQQYQQPQYQQSGQYQQQPQYQQQAGQYQQQPGQYQQPQPYQQQTGQYQDPNYYGQAQYNTNSTGQSTDSYVDLSQQNAASSQPTSTANTASANDYQDSNGGGHPKIKGAMSGLAKMVGAGASVAAPIAGMYMMNKMMQKQGYGYGSGYGTGYGYGGMPYGSAYGMPYGSSYGMPGYGYGTGMMPGYGYGTGMGMGGMPYGGYGVGNTIMNLGLQGLRGY